MKINYVYTALVVRNFALSVSGVIAKITTRIRDRPRSHDHKKIGEFPEGVPKFTADVSSWH